MNKPALTSCTIGSNESLKHRFDNVLDSC